MIALVKNNVVWYGPAPYDVNAIVEKLYELGYTRQAGQLTNPDGVACSIPAEGALPAELAGCSMLPVVDVVEDAPAGKIDGGLRTLTVTSEAIERRVAWVDAPPASPAVRTMSKYTFLNRFTPEELGAATAKKREGDIHLEVAQTLLDAARDVDLDDPNIQGYVSYLVSLGVLTQERAGEILG